VISRAVLTAVWLAATPLHSQAQEPGGQRASRQANPSARVPDHGGSLLIVQPPATSELPRAGTATPLFDAERADVAGLRVGGKARDFAVTATRLFGAVARVPRNREWYPGYAAALEIKAKECGTTSLQRHGGRIGSVCVTAFLDDEDIVRGVRIERVFPYMDGDTFRATMVQRYGAANAGQEIGGRSLGWGPVVDPRLAFDSAGPGTSLTAHYSVMDDVMHRSLNVAPQIRVTLQLVDAGWALRRR
jgi:hypothetical protein